MGAYSRGAVTREWALNRAFTVIDIVNVYRGLDHVYLRLATFREILLSSSGKVNGEVFTIYRFSVGLK